MLSAADAARLQKGQALSLRAATGVDFDLDVTVERIGREENGRVIVVLRGGSHLAYVTLLRAQNVELILARYEGLRIPKNALRVDADGSSGVYCLVGLRAYRKPVEVLWQGEGLLSCPARRHRNEQRESLRQLYTLRAGDRRSSRQMIYTMERWSNEHEHSGKHSAGTGKTLPPRRSPPGAGPRTSRLSARAR